MKKIYFLSLTVLFSALSFGQTVFINEIHYDNVSTDTDEGVEIAGPAGTDLSTYTLTAYNGSNGLAYVTQPLIGSIPDQDSSGFGTIWVPLIGLQNGAPDGIALDNNGTLIQFLSYEGSFVAGDGAANGVTSTDIGVSETSSTDYGESLQLIGSGNTYDEFTWAGPIWNSLGWINTGQTFTSSDLPTLSVYDGPPNGATFTADPETPNPGNAAISFVTSHFTMSTDAGGGTGTGGDGFIKWTGQDTSDSSLIDGGNVFISNNPLIEEPINNLVAGHTYFFRAELVDNSGAPLSSPVVYSFTVTIATYTDVANLVTLRTQTVDPDLYYRVTGSVINTHTIQDMWQTMYFQDGTAGIQVSDFNWELLNYNRGDAVSNIRGRLESINGVLTLIPTDTDWGSPDTTGNTPGVSTVTIASLLTNWEDYESQLVNINGATFADGDGINMFDYQMDYDINDGATTIFRTAFNTDYIFSPIPTGAQNIVAIVSEDNGTVYVTSRDSSDITSAPLSTNDFDMKSVKLYPNPTSLGYVHLTNKNNAKMQASVFDILGKQVLNKTVANNRLDVSNLKSGIYVIKVAQNGSTSTQKLVIK